MDWKPIETAPTDVVVQLGRWRTSYGESAPMRWEVDISKAWVTTRLPFGLKRRKRVIDSESYSHWKPAPEPPKD